MPSANELKQQGLAYYQKDQLAEAADYFAQAAGAYDAQAEPLSAAEARNNLAVVRLAQQDWPKALAAVWMRADSKVCINCLNPWPSTPPKRFSAFTSKSSKRISNSFMPR